MNSRVDRRLKIEGHDVRFTAKLDAETLRFENEFFEAGHHLNFLHGHSYLKLSRQEFYLLQIRTPGGQPSCQVAVFIYRPSRLRQFGKAIVLRMTSSISEQEEIFKLKRLREFCLELGDVTQLRLQTACLEPHKFELFRTPAARAGFEIAKPLFYTHTLKFDLKPAAELLPLMSGKLRSKLRPPRTDFQLTVLTEKRHLDSCRQALNASFERTRGVANDFDFEAAFEAAKSFPKQARIVGMIREGHPNDILAFAVAYVSGKSAEFVVAGSKNDPGLRKIPFNYLIFWELIQWAQENGAAWIDLGGVTPVSPEDPLAGISQFKRHFTKNEIEICREFTTTLRPLRAWFFNCAQQARQLLS